MDTKYIDFKLTDNILYLGFGKETKKSMTVLDEPTLTELKTVLDEATRIQNDLKAVIFYSLKKNVFLAGADISLIDSLTEESEASEGAAKGQELYNMIEDLSTTTIACVDGPCLGGGLELALSCDHIICSDSSKTVLGLPEVKLGILPGFGGTYRLPKKVGLPNSLDMILSGKMLSPRKAKKLGLVVDSYPKEKLLDAARIILNRKIKDKSSFSESLQSFAMENALGRKIVFQKARESVLKLTKGQYEAPLKILDLMEKHVGSSRSAYLRKEAESFGELCVGAQSKNLRHIFFMMEQSKKSPFDNIKSRTLKSGAVLGAGTMGGGIAWLMADNGMPTIMKDLNIEALELGYRQASSNFRQSLKRKKITQEGFQKKQRLIIGQTDYKGFGNVDLIIEAIIENMDIKKSVFSELEKNVDEKCLITSNTSSLSINEMSKALEKPDRFAGLHFFNPVNKMPLVEIIKHDNVSDETLASLHQWVVKSKKTPVIVGDGPGFLVNRILMPYLNEAGYLLTEGVSIKDLDDACLKFGMPMGPCRLLDEIGIDVADKVAQIMFEGLGDRAKDSGQAKSMIEKNFLGKKTGKGFYLYDEKGKVQGINPEVEQMLPTSKTMDRKEIQMRVVLPMINEACYILDEKIVNSADQVDLGLIFGIGFPPFRGGLCKYADEEGLDRLYTAINGFSESISKDRYSASPFFTNLVKEKKKFYDL